MKINSILLTLVLVTGVFFFTSTLTADESQSNEDTQIMQTIADTMPNAVTFTMGNRAIGSGFYITPTKVLTNLHVIDSLMIEGKVGFTTQQGQLIIANVTKYDKEQDFAILDVPFNAHVRTLQTAEVKVGQTVLILGNPKGMVYSATKGMVSYLDRPSGYKKSIQIDTNVTNGHSGSMVITTDGFLVGVMVERLKNSGFQNQWDVGFAIPINIIK